MYRLGEVDGAVSPPALHLGARQVVRPSGHVLQPFPTRAGARGEHGGGTELERTLGLKKKAQAIAARFAEEHVGRHSDYRSIC